MFIYIHGFNSSPASWKATRFKQYIQDRHPQHQVLVPHLSNLPEPAIQLLKSLIEQSQTKNITLVGSSLGGFYATYLASQFDLKAVLINPAVRPYELLEAFLGPNQNIYTGERYELTEEHIGQLKNLYIDNLEHPDRFLVLVQQGDEVLDARQAMSYYSHCQLIIEEGGDHSFQGIEKYFGKIVEFSEV